MARLVVAFWVTARRAIAAITNATMMIRNIAATRPKPASFRSGRIVDMNLLQEADGFAVGAQRQPNRHQTAADIGARRVGKTAVGAIHLIDHGRRSAVVIVGRQRVELATP